ncbi:GNAT family N-acetyltransferase [Denitratisoma sp. agr-D3]
MPFQLLDSRPATTTQPDPLHLHLRQLTEADRAAAARHLHSLDRDDRYDRFGSALNDAGIRRYVDSMDFVRHGLFGVLHRPPGSDPLLAGLLHLVPWAQRAELGASVLPPYRGQGLASALFAAALSHGRTLGIREVVCVSGHPAVPRICRRIECPMTPWPNSGWLLLP